MRVEKERADEAESQAGPCIGRPSLLVSGVDAAQTIGKARSTGIENFLPRERRARVAPLEYVRHVEAERLCEQRQKYGERQQLPKSRIHMR